MSTAEEGPAFYTNITKLVDSVINNSTLEPLIPEISKLSPYLSLSPGSRILYIRLYLRKRSWLRPLSFIKYTDVGNVGDSVTELCKSGFLIKLGECSEDLLVEELLDKLLSKEIKEVCKFFHLKTTTQTLTSMKSQIIKMCKSQRTLFGSTSGLRVKVKKKCLDILSDLVKVSEGLATLLDRALIASFPQFILSYEEDDKTTFTGKGNLSRILLSSFGLADKFPTYKISFDKPLISSSSQLENFLSACQLEAQCHSHTENREWEKIKLIYQNNIDKFKEIVKSWSKMEHTSNSSYKYMLQFTEEWVLGRVMRHCLESLQRLKDYSTAVELLRLLIQFKPMKHRHGVWHETLCLILDYHLSETAAARDAAYCALADTHTKYGSRIAIETRLKKLDCNYVPEFTFEPKKVEIEVVQVEGSGSAAKSKKVWVGRTLSGDTVLGGVEDAAMYHYMNHHGFREGRHCEGAIVATLFGILCWDEIFCDVENVFFNQFQYHPLDFDTIEFYENRRDLFSEKFEKLRTATESEMTALIKGSWDRNHGVGCKGTQWDLFTDVDQCVRCVLCLTSPRLVLIFEDYVRDPRLKRSGLPDLVLWSFETRDFRMVEVKGPGDMLRTNQKMWLSRLDQFGIKSEVCHVVATSNKRLIKSTRMH